MNGATLSATITSTLVTGNLSVQSGTLNNGGFAITLASGKNLALSSGATFNLTGTSTMVSVSGGGTKTFDPASTVNYAGAGAAQNVSAENYGNLLQVAPAVARNAPSRNYLGCRRPDHRTQHHVRCRSEQLQPCRRLA